MTSVVKRALPLALKHSRENWVVLSRAPVDMEPVGDVPTTPKLTREQESAVLPQFQFRVACPPLETFTGEAEKLQLGKFFGVQLGPS